MLRYYRKIKIDGEVIVSRDWDIETKTIKRKPPKHLKRKRLYWNSSTGIYYYLKEVPVAKVRVLGAFKDKACTIVQKI